jgi:hypothetical protein
MINVAIILGSTRPGRVGEGDAARTTTSGADDASAEATV